MRESQGTSSRAEVLARLMRRSADRDWQAFSMLYSMTSSQLFGLMLSMTNYAHVCEDLLQEVYITAWKKAGDYDPKKAAVSTWLCTIARNRTLDWLRSESTKAAKTGFVQDSHTLDLASGLDGPDQWAESDSSQTALQACLENLTSDQRHAILLAYFEGHSHAELARRLNSALGTVKSWVRRGLASLKVCLQSSGGEA